MAEELGRQLPQPGAAQQQGPGGEQALVVGRRRVEAHRGEADEQRPLALGQVVDEHQVLGERLRVVGETHHGHGLAAAALDLGRQGALAGDGLHGAGPAEDVEHTAGGRILVQAVHLVGDVHLVVVLVTHQPALGDGREAAVEEEALHAQHGEQTDGGGRGQYQRVPLPQAAAERVPSGCLPFQVVPPWVSRQSGPVPPQDSRWAVAGSGPPEEDGGALVRAQARRRCRHPLGDGGDPLPEAGPGDGGERMRVHVHERRGPGPRPQTGLQNLDQKYEQKYQQLELNMERLKIRIKNMKKR